MNSHVERPRLLLGCDVLELVLEDVTRAVRQRGETRERGKGQPQRSLSPHNRRTQGWGAPAAGSLRLTDTHEF